MNVETTNSCVCVGFCLKVDNSTKCTVFVKNAVKNILERIQKERVIWLRVSTMADAREMAVKRKQTERYRDPQLKGAVQKKQ